MSGSHDLEPDELGPWAVLTFERAEGAEAILTAYGPMLRSAAEAPLEVLDLPEPWTVPLQPAKATVEGVVTRAVVAFGDDATRLAFGQRALDGVRERGEIAAEVAQVRHRLAPGYLAGDVAGERGDRQADVRCLP